MDNHIRFACPVCHQRLKAPPSFAGRRAKCTRPGCGTSLRVPDEVFELDDAEGVLSLGPLPLPPATDPTPGPGSYPPRRRGPEPRERQFPWELAICASVLLLVAAGAYGAYWWSGQPSAEQVAVYENFLRTSNELIDMHAAVTDPAEAGAARPKLLAKAQENLELMKQRHAIPKGRKKDNLERRFGPQVDEVLKKLAALLTSNKPVLVLPSVSDKGEYVIIQLGTDDAGGGSVEGTDGTAGQVPADRLANLAGAWDCDEFSLAIAADGKGRAELRRFSQGTGSFSISNGGGPVTLTAEFTVQARGEELAFSFTVEPTKGLKSTYEFVVTAAGSDELTVKEAGNRVSPNPVTLRRRSAGTTPPAPPAATAPAAAPAPQGTGRAGAKLKFSDLTVTRTTFDPPAVEFTIRLDVDGGRLLEAWASVGVKDAGRVLEGFAGALDQGLLSVNGIDFANPAPDLKAQRVAMKASPTDPTLYTCKVTYPKLRLAEPVTEFTVVAAIDKDKKIVKTNAATVRVDLKTGQVLKGAGGNEKTSNPSPAPTAGGGWEPWLAEIDPLKPGAAAPALTADYLPHRPGTARRKTQTVYDDAGKPSSVTVSRLTYRDGGVLASRILSLKNSTGSVSSPDLFPDGITRHDVKDGFVRVGYPKDDKKPDAEVSWYRPLKVGARVGDRWNQVSGGNDPANERRYAAAGTYRGKPCAVVAGPRSYTVYAEGVGPMLYRSYQKVGERLVISTEETYE
jgi:hypothetical protein